MRDYLKLISFLKGHERLFFLAVATMFIAGLFEIFSFSLFIPLIDVVLTDKDIVIPNIEHFPRFLRDLVDMLNAMEPRRLLYIGTSLFAGAFIFKNVLVFGYQYFMGDVSQKVMRDIRYRLYQTIQNLSLDYFSEKRTGELISRITHDVHLVENAVSYGLTDLFRQTFMIIFWITVAFSIDPKAALVIFCIFPFIGYPMSRIGSRLKKISKGIQEKMADINSLLLETISGVKLVKAFCTEEYETERFKGQNHAYYKLRMASIKRLIIVSPLTEVLGGICGSVLIVWFFNRVIDGEISFGVFGLFFASFMNIISPIKKLGNVNAITQQALSANERIYDVLNEVPTVEEKANPQELKEIHNSIRLNNVSFHYYKESGLVLKNIDLEIKKGELVAIVGPTGTGKTTLVNLIPRFYDASEGEVLIDGKSIKDYSLKSLRNQFGIVTQESILFNDTVKANIAYGHQLASVQEVREVAKKAYAHRFIKDMPDGYDTIIGDRGFRLSGGEKQRISIARAILKNPPILILDEATSQLDSESEKFVQDALDELMKGRTVIAIAHRLSTIMKADKIVVLEKGKIVGLGKHAELLESCPLYSKLHAMQFQV